MASMVGAQQGSRATGRGQGFGRRGCAAGCGAQQGYCAARRGMGPGKACSVAGRITCHILSSGSFPRSWMFAQCWHGPCLSLGGSIFPPLLSLSCHAFLYLSVMQYPCVLITASLHTVLSLCVVNRLCALLQRWLHLGAGGGSLHRHGTLGPCGWMC